MVLSAHIRPVQTPGPVKFRDACIFPGAVMVTAARAGAAGAFCGMPATWAPWIGKAAPRSPGGAVSDGAFPGIGRGGEPPSWQSVDVCTLGTRLWSRAVISEATRLRKARYRRSAKGRAAGAAAQARYRRSAKGKAATARYRRSEKRKAANAKACARYRQSEKGKATAMRYRARRKERSADASSRP
jgi:hypothetical protein